MKWKDLKEDKDYFSGDGVLDSLDFGEMDEDLSICSAHNDSYFFRPPKDDGSFTMSW